MFTDDLGGALLRSAGRHQDRPALWAAGERLSYTQLFDAAAHVAGSIIAEGAAPGDRVAVLCQRTKAPYVAIVGALLAGCTYVPLNTKFPRPQNQRMIEASDAKVLVCDAANADESERLAVGLKVIVLDNGGGSGSSAPSAASPEAVTGPQAWEAVRRAVPPGEAAYLMFTSGTTGVPKGVPISHLNVAAYLAGISEVGAIHRDDRVLQFVSLTFDLSVHDMFLTWLAGAELYSTPESAELLTPRLIAQHKVTACLLVPSPAARMVEQGTAKSGGMPSLRLSYFCGEAFPRSLATAWSQAAPNSRVLNIYGPTEATVAFSFYEYDQSEASELPVLPIGRPLPRQMMRVFSPDMEPLEQGVSGQLCLAGSQLAKGYWRNSAITDEKFTQVEGVRWYKTGDLGRWVEPYGYVFSGRADRQVKIRSFLVDLQDIEGALRTITGRQQVAVVPWPVRTQGSADGCVAFVAGEQMDAQPIQAALRKALAGYMVPERILFIPELPLNANGKTDYNHLGRHPALAS